MWIPYDSMAGQGCADSMRDGDYPRSPSPRGHDIEKFKDVPHPARGVAWYHSARYNEALNDYIEALRLEPASMDANNQLAWMLSVCPDQKYRNASKALDLAKKAVAVSEGPTTLDTLAAAYAESGDFKAAVEIQEKVVAQAKASGTEELKKYMQRLEAYKNRRPWRRGGQACKNSSSAASAMPIQTGNSPMDHGMASSSVEAGAEEGVMISQSCDFDEFFEGVRDQDYLEVIYLADKEATEAERLKFRSKAAKTLCSAACVSYADALKGFIRYMRYGVRSPSMEGNQHEGLKAFREAVLGNYMEIGEYMEATGGEE